MSDATPLSEVSSVEVSQKVRNVIYRWLVKEKRHCVVLTASNHEPLLQISLRESVCPQLIDYKKLEEGEIADTLQKYADQTRPGEGHKFLFMRMLVCHIKNVKGA